jgi:hypothetical protein
MSNKLHWYALVYGGEHIKTELPSTGTTYVGFKLQQVTHPQIMLHMKSANIKNGILLNCSYLGFMTQYEFENNVSPGGGDGEGVPVLSIVSAA